MKVSELIKELQVLMEEHGNVDVYSIADYCFVESAYFDPEWESYKEIKPVIVLE